MDDYVVVISRPNINEVFKFCPHSTHCSDLGTKLRPPMDTQFVRDDVIVINIHGDMPFLDNTGIGNNNQHVTS